MKYIINLLLISLYCFAIPMISEGNDYADGSYCLSLKSKLPNNARISQFRLNITSGRIKYISDIPPGWNISINNDPSWNSNVRANIIVGAAALNAKKFDDLICIEIVKFSDLKFELAGEIATISNSDEEIITKISSNNFILKSK